MEKIKKINFNFKYILKYFTIFLMCLIFANASINGLSPFLYALFFTLLFVGFDEKLSAIFVLSSAVCVSPTLETLLISVSVIGVGLVTYYIHKLTKKNIGIVTIFTIYLLSLVTFIYYNHADLINLTLYFVLGLICLFVFITVFQVLLLRKNCFKLTLNESICYLFTIAVLGIGLAPVSVFDVSLYRLVLMLAILVLVSIGKPSLTYAIVLSFSFGVSLYSFSLLPISEFCLLALIGGIFSMPSKFKIIITVMLAEILVQYYFYYQDMIILYEIVPVVIGCLIFVLLPNKLLNNLSDIVYVKKSDMSTRNLINSTRKNIRKRMSELSNVFQDMKRIHLNMVKRELSKDELIAMLSREIMNSCCVDCLDKNRCTRSLGTDNKSSLETLIEIAITKGKVSLLDLPPGLTTRCGKVNYLITSINRISNEYKQYKNIMADVNNVKILLADQMGAVSRLLLDIGEEVDSNVSFDIERENKIISRLLSQNIECNEVLLYTEKNDDMHAVLIIKGENAFSQVIERIISETLHTQMQITNVVPVENGNFNSVTLRKKNRYDIIFGLASCNKSGNEECGDCHSIIRLGGDRFLLALCDGMGTGKPAHKMSAMTLGLIENFYKVGFDNDIVLESVNKLLAINNQESYSTLDVCLIDLNREIADFIKVGSPYGLIKRDSNIEIVEGGALPIGALDSISPSTYKTTIATKDMIIMATDGVTDAFDGVEACTEYITKLVNTNPQTMAESILNEALRLNSMSAKDDMTVLVARTYLKNSN